MFRRFNLKLDVMKYQPINGMEAADLKRVFNLVGQFKHSACRGETMSVGRGLLITLHARKARLSWQIALVIIIIGFRVICLVLVLVCF